MVAKIPIRTVYTGAAATGLAEFQAGEFLDYPVGGTGQTTLGTANQILATNAGATAIVWADPTTGDITGVTAGNGISGGGTSGTVAVAIDTTITADLTTAQTFTNKTLTSPTISGGTVSVTQVDITAQGDLRLQDTTGGQYVALQAPGTVATSYTLTFPGDDGTNEQFLQTNGSGVLAWAAAGGATGAGGDEVFYENGQTVTTDYSVTASTNAMSAGPVTLASGVDVTLTGTSEWVIV